MEKKLTVFLFILLKLYEHYSEFLFPGYYPLQPIKPVYYSNISVILELQRGGFTPRIIQAETRYYSDIGWIKGYLLFSLITKTRKIIQFRDLRALNEFILKPSKEFSSHPHYKMEIVTIVLEGEVTHENNSGKQGSSGEASLERKYFLHIYSEEDQLVFIYISIGELFVNGRRLRQETRLVLIWKGPFTWKIASASPAEFIAIYLQTVEG